MVVQKNIAVMLKYYEKNFKLHANVMTMDCQQYCTGHKIYRKHQFNIAFHTIKIPEQKAAIKLPQEFL
jgi:hypothetical protein